MLDRVKWLIISHLWHRYSTHLGQVAKIQAALQTQYNEVLVFDHFALIDLPGPYTGMHSLARLFFHLDYAIGGQDYLSEKQNDFMWLTERSSETQRAEKVFPQVVVADFRREALAPEVRKIIDHYAAFAKPLEEDRLKFLKRRILQKDDKATHEFLALIAHYLQGRDWPLPTVKEFEVVKNHNELLAWVLVRGRQVNHFAWAIHLSENFKSLQAFNCLVSETLQISLNKKGNLIKGNRLVGIQQSATLAPIQSMRLADGRVDLSDRFIEFVWRYPVISAGEKPVLWKDYFTGFVANNADHVVESLYLD